MGDEVGGNVRGKRRIRKQIWCRNLNDLGVGIRILLKWILKKYDLKVWIRFICFRMESSDGLL
jgi:hypothetical protein